MVVEKTFQEVINTINDGEIWLNKYKNKRLTKIQKTYNSIIFEFDDEYKDIGVSLNDIFILDKKKYTFEEAMKSLKEGKEIESCYSGTKYITSPNRNESVFYFDTEYNKWITELHMFSHNEIFGDWYINN